MAETISQKICELCEIKPKQPERLCKECNLTMAECSCITCSDYVYPDFTNPENFVQLLELKHKYSDFIIDTFNYPKDKTFMEIALADILTGISAYKTEEQKFIQAIHDYDGWKWG
ncbi:MAG: hypothetical protein NC191_10000 [Muribaculaceae bacterium]|nr:hypothetical protein [Muribaculaceae bacterium]